MKSKKSVFYPSIKEILDLQNQLIDRYGGDRGVIDLGLIESALHRAKSGYYKSLSEQAAALFQSFALNHCFVDGNKRIAFMAMYVFLRTNGYRLAVDIDVAEKFIVNEVIIAKASISEVSDRLERYMVKK